MSRLGQAAFPFQQQSAERVLLVSVGVLELGQEVLIVTPNEWFSMDPDDWPRVDVPKWLPDKKAETIFSPPRLKGRRLERWVWLQLKRLQYPPDRAV